MGVALEPTLAQAADAPTPNKGDTAWMLTASALVLLMTIPGLALFYGGLVRTKNMLSMLMQVFYTVCIVIVIWALYGYSLAFSEGTTYNSFFGGFSKAFLAGVTAESNVETFTDGVVIPELVYICFQMTFAAITPALIVGAMAERMKFSAIAIFIPLWVTFVYFPIAHMVWYWAGPAATVGAAKAIAAATDPAAKAAAETAAAAVSANAGLAFQWGAIDFAGGTVVHINSGIAALVGALMVGKRVGYGKEAMPPHSLTLTLVGGALLWVGWFGFNAGSALEAGGTAALAMANTFVATAAAALAWLVVENIAKGKPSLLGAVTGAVAGLVAVTPASGFAGPMGALVLGLIAGVVCFIACSAVKSALGYDDALDVFGVHCIGGIVGALLTGILANPALGGTGIFDYAAGKVADFDTATQLWAQFKAVCLTLVWSGVGTLVLLGIVRLIVGLRPASDQEREGLDLVDHGERAYNY
ncbi:MAG TPA: ammonium transporter [Hyphomicrobiaceae bacterium]|jgi:Amt family ammonium transporter|nr:ammonium transporter [Hyphomicrobiaceae bacterium]